MADIIAFTETDGSQRVRAVAASLARTLKDQAQVRPMSAEPQAMCAEVLLAMSEATAGLAVLPYRPGNAARLVAEVIRHCPKPVVLVPVERRVPIPELISRVLVPLDGTVEAAESVSRTVARFASSGADIIVLHVFDQNTVPRFWDQAAHARTSWDLEFLARFCDQPTARLELRRGSPGTSILEVAASEQAELIFLGWTQDLSAGRARTVRTTLEQSDIPILLLPTESRLTGDQGMRAESFRSGSRR